MMTSGKKKKLWHKKKTGKLICSKFMSKILQNIRSIHRTFSELEMMIKDKKNKPILFALTETCCNKYSLKNAVSLESFQQNEMESREKLKGGVGFYIQSDFFNKKVFKLQENNGF